MKYQKEFDEVFSIMRLDWMNEEDYEMLVNECLKFAGKTKEDFDNDLDKGVENGHPVEKQVQLLKQFFEKNLNEVNYYNIV
jgi:hypothetical protein